MTIQVVIVVLCCEGDGECLCGIDTHGDALRVAADKGGLVAVPFGIAPALAEPAAVDHAEPFKGTERECAAEAEILGVVLVETLCYESLAFGKTAFV